MLICVIAQSVGQLGLIYFLASFLLLAGFLALGFLTTLPGALAALLLLDADFLGLATALAFGADLAATFPMFKAVDLSF